MIWAKAAWSRLHEMGLTKADTPMDELDTIVRAISMASFHLIFCHNAHLSEEPDTVTPNLSYICSTDVASLAIIRYGTEQEAWPDIAYSLEEALAAVYLEQVPQTLIALSRHCGSPKAFHRELLELSPCTRSSLNEPEQLRKALDYARWLGGVSTDRPKLRVVHPVIQKANDGRSDDP
jgi:hypothetical protein